MQIDAIVSDLDDTLLNEDSVLSPYTLDVMARARDRGIRVIPASGRAAFSMLRFLRQLNTGMPYIACNGGQLVGPDHVVTDEFTFSAQEAQAIIRYLKSHGFYVQCYRDEHFYYDEECEASESYRQSSKMYGHAVGKLETFVDFATPKLLSVQDPERVMQMYEQIQPIFPNVTFTISKPYFLEA